MNPLALIKSASAAHPIRREMTVVPKVLDAANGIMRFTASDETLDCYNEIVRVGGWKFTHFMKNGPFVNSHDYSNICHLLGQVINWDLSTGALVEDVQFALTPEGETMADWAFAMYRDGFLRACSVGFCPVRYATKWDSDKTSLLEQIGLLKLDAQTAAKLNVVYIEQEQLELSACVIGANPNALAKSFRSIADAYKAGTLDEADVQKISALIANTKNAAPAADSANAGAASPRTKSAIVAVIQSHLV